MKKYFCGFSINHGSFLWTHEIQDAQIIDVEQWIESKEDASFTLYLTRKSVREYWNVNFDEDFDAPHMRKNLTLNFFSKEDLSRVIDVSAKNFVIREAMPRAVKKRRYEVYVPIGYKSLVIAVFDNEEQATECKIRNTMSFKCKVKVGKWFTPNTSHIEDFPMEYYYRENEPSVTWDGMIPKDEYLIDFTKTNINVSYAKY